MEPDGDSHDVGRHLLGPHVVGRRVVVRRLVPGETGPTGGPAMTDLLGTCLSWSSEACVIAPESGPPVRIPLSLIVSGKPVPPRPAARSRVSVRSAESHAGPLWPDVERVPLGDWELRHASAGRPVRRTTSCLAVGDPGTSYADAAAQVRAFYADRGRGPLAQVEAGSDAEAALRDLGWAPLPHGEADFLLASVAQVRRRLGPAAAAALATDGPRAVATVDTGDEVLAEARAGVDGDWVGLHAVAVVPTHRRRGLGRAVLAALLEWAAEQGAATAWLHAETDNRPGLAFHESLGFVAHHRLRYLTVP